MIYISDADYSNVSKCMCMG